MNGCPYCGSGRSTYDDGVRICEGCGHAFPTEQENTMTSTADTARALESLKHTVEHHRTAYEEAKEKFLEQASTNPSYAIEWGRSMVEAQAAYEAVFELLDRDLDAEFVHEHVARLERRVRMQHSQSTSMLANGVEMSKWDGTVRVLEMLEGYAGRL